MQAKSDAGLQKLGVISSNALEVSNGTAQQLSTRAQIDEQRLTNFKNSMEAQLASEKAKLEQARAVYQLAQRNREMLQVRAGMDGILQELSLNGNTLQEGQQVPAGTTIAKVTNPRRLKAELKIPETQAKERPDRAAGAGRYAQRRDRWQGDPDRSLGAERHAHGRRGADWRPAAGRSPGPERRWHH